MHGQEENLFLLVNRLASRSPFHSSWLLFNQSLLEISGITDSITSTLGCYMQVASEWGWPVGG